MSLTNGRISFYVNNRDLNDVAVAGGYRVEVEGIDGSMGGLALVTGSEGLPGRIGSVVTTDRIAADPGSVVANLRVITTSAAALAGAVEEIRGYLAQASVSEVRIRSDYVLGREALARLTQIVTVQDETFSARIEAHFQLDDPQWVERAPRFYALPAPVSTVPQRVALPLGSGHVGAVIRIRGPGENPTLTYRDARGNVVATMELTVVLDGTEYLDIDTSAGSIVMVSDGVVGSIADGLALLDEASDFPVLSPVDADLVGSGWPTMEIDDDDETCTGWVAYRRSYA